MILSIVFDFSMEDAMVPKYEFWTNQWKAKNSQNRQITDNRKYLNSEPGLRGKLFDLLGDAMISGGTWLKKSSQPQIDDHSAALNTRN